MIHFEPLASSSAGCAYRVSCGKHAPLLIDCGLRFKELQKALNFQVSRLAGCLVSHAHGDHSKAVPELRARGIEVRASTETWSQLGLKDHHRAHFLHPSMGVKVGEWIINCFSTVHDSPGSLGFVIDSPEGDRLLYLTDSVYSTVRWPGLTHLAVECNHSVEILKRNSLDGTIDRERYKRTLQTHMSLERLLELLAANDLSQVQEIHLLHLSDANSDADGFRRRVREATGCPTYVCEARAVRT